MGGKDKEKQPSRHKKSGNSSSSHRKQSSSSSSNTQTSSSRREPSSRTARDTLPETQYENEDEGDEYAEDEPEYDHPPRSGEEREEGFPDVTYIGSYTAPGATQRPSAQTGHDPRHSQPEQVRNQAPQYSQPPESTSRRVEARAYPTSPQGQQTPSYYAASYAQPAGTQQTSSYYAAGYAQPAGTQQTSPYYAAGYAQPAGTQRNPGRPGATARSYSSTPGYNTARTPEETSSGGQYSTESAAATVPPQYPYTTTPNRLYSSSSLAPVAASADSGLAADPRTRRWQGMEQNLQHRPVESWDDSPNEQKTINDDVNRIGHEYDDTGS